MHIPLLFKLLIALFLLSSSPVTTQANPQPRIVGGVESQENAWPYAVGLMYKNLGVTVGSEAFTAYFMAHSPARLFSGKLIDCGNAFDVCEGAEGNICLISRGETNFSEKANNCESGGGIGAIIHNNVEGIYFGNLGTEGPNIPVVSISQANGVILLNHLGEDVTFGYSSDIPGDSFCGATYIGGKWLVTAAHCVEDTHASALFANIGGHDIAVDKSHVLDISRIIAHQNYDADRLGYDIALVELVEEPAGITSVLIASEEILDLAISNKDPVTALGRGIQEAFLPGGEPPLDPGPSQLFEVEINLISNQTCNAAINDYYASEGGAPIELVKDDMVCAGTQQGDVGTCLGDSGGPLILQQGGQDYLVGVTSWGLGCAAPGLYDVFSRASYFKTAIEKVISGEMDRLEPLPVKQKDDKTFFLSMSREIIFLFYIIIMWRFYSRVNSRRRIR